MNKESREYPLREALARLHRHGGFQSRATARTLDSSSKTPSYTTYGANDDAGNAKPSRA